MTLADLYLMAKSDRYTQDKHSNYKVGDIAEWKDGFHQKTSHGWEKLPNRQSKEEVSGFGKRLRNEFTTNTNKYLNTDFTNKSSGIKASFSKESQDELKSRTINTKSNGFTLEEHFEMANQIKHLFENARLVTEHGDQKHHDKNVRIKRLLSRPVKLKSGKKAQACITVKYTISKDKHLIYSLEGMDIKNALDETRAKRQDLKENS